MGERFVTRGFIGRRDQDDSGGGDDQDRRDADGDDRRRERRDLPALRALAPALARLPSGEDRSAVDGAPHRRGVLHRDVLRGPRRTGLLERSQPLGVRPRIG